MAMAPQQLGEMNIQNRGVLSARCGEYTNAIGTPRPLGELTYYRAVSNNVVITGFAPLCSSKLFIARLNSRFHNNPCLHKVK